MSSDSTQTIQHSALRFSLGTLLSRSTGMFRDVAMAYAFGTEPAIAAFMVSFRFAHFARRLFGEGSLQNTFIPHFEELRYENPAIAFAFFRDIKLSLSVFLILFIFGVMALLGTVQIFVLETSTSLILKLTAWMLPSLLFICLFGLNSALLNCEKRFFTPAAAPVVFNLVWIIATLFLGHFEPLYAAVGMSFSVIIACAAQWLFTVPQTLKIIKNAGRLPSLQLFSGHVRRLAYPLFLANVGIAASQINNALDPLFALYANSQGPAWLWYAIRIQQLPIALLGIAFASALLPPISRAIKSGQIAQSAYFFNFAINRLLKLLIPLTFGIIVLAPSSINFLFGHGQFNLESVAGSSLCLIGYSLGLFPSAFVLIAAPTLYALKDFKTPASATAYSVIFSIALNAFCIFIFQFGAASVAFSTSLAAFVNAFILSYEIKKRLDNQFKRFTANFFSLILLSMIAFAAVCFVDWIVLKEIPAINVLIGKSLPFTQNLLSQLGILIMEAATFFVTFTLVAFAINNDVLKFNEFKVLK